jgi:3-hydroxyacyl-[acyl-carrier-protein] dehydratase
VKYINVQNFKISEDKKSMTATLNINKNHWVFDEHFPGFPIYPGAMMIENLAQHCVVLMASSQDKTKPVIPTLIQVDRAKFMDPVIPDCTLEISIKKEMEMYPNFKFIGEISVNGRKAASARLTMAFKDLGVGAGIDLMQFFLKENE